MCRVLHVACCVDYVLCVARCTLSGAWRVVRCLGCVACSVLLHCLLFGVCCVLCMWHCVVCVACVVCWA